MCSVCAVGLIVRSTCVRWKCCVSASLRESWRLTGARLHQDWSVFLRVAARSLTSLTLPHAEGVQLRMGGGNLFYSVSSIGSEIVQHLILNMLPMVDK